MAMPFSGEDFSDQGIFQMRYNIVTPTGEVINEGQVSLAHAMTFSCKIPWRC